MDRAAVAAGTPGFALRKGGKCKQDAWIPGKAASCPCCLDWVANGALTLGDTGVTGSSVVQVLWLPALPPVLALGTLCQGMARRRAAAGKYRWAQVQTRVGMDMQGTPRTAHTRAQTRTCRHGHTDPGTHTGVGTGVHRGAHTWTRVGTPAQAHVPLRAHIVTRAFTGSPRAADTHSPGKTLSPHHVHMCQPTREVTVMPVTLGNANR